MTTVAKLNFPTDAEINAMFGTVGTLDKYKVGDKVLTAGSSVILKRAKKLAPRGNQRDRDKRAKKQKDKANWNTPLWKTIKRVIRKSETGGYAIVGPEWPTGNKAYFDTSPKGRRVFYWGKDAGKTRMMVRNWIVQAADETRGQQLDAMKSKLQEVMGDVIRG